MNFNCYHAHGSQLGTRLSASQLASEGCEQSAACGFCLWSVMGAADASTSTTAGKLGLVLLTARILPLGLSSYGTSFWLPLRRLLLCKPSEPDPATFPFYLPSAFCLVQLTITTRMESVLCRASPCSMMATARGHTKPGSRSPGSTFHPVQTGQSHCAVTSYLA